MTLKYFELRNTQLPCDERTEPSDDISEVIVSSTSDDESVLEKVKHAVRLHKSALVEELLSEVYILENHGQGVRSIRGLALPNVNLLKKGTLSLIASMGLRGVSSDEIEYNIWQALWLVRTPFFDSIVLVIWRSVPMIYHDFSMFQLELSLFSATPACRCETWSVVKCFNLVRAS